MPYVYSTATCSTTYCVYEEQAVGNVAILRKWPDGKPMKVMIQGGHGVSDKHFFTPKGVVTKVTDRDMELLLENPSFLKHIERGFMAYDKKNIAPEKKARDMADKDGSAPLTHQDFVEGLNSSKEAKIWKAKSSEAA